LKTDQAQTSITALFKNTVRKDAKIHNAYLLVHSDKLGIRLNLAEGATGDMPAEANQPFYIASISKLFTSVLIGILVEKGLMAYDDPISSYVDQALLTNLHVYMGTDYTNEIRIKHLLNHTSGLHDFFEDKPRRGKSFIDLIFDEPSRAWTPESVIHWAKDHLTPHFPPGQKFHYSDTGYHLLGLAIQQATSMPLHAALRHYIFEPLDMHHSYLSNYAEPLVKSEYPVARLYGRNIDITGYSSLSMMFAGGGIVSTTADMLKFMKAITRHELIGARTFERMKDWAKFFPGIDYGYGLMHFKTVPVLMPQKYNGWGNAGSSGTFMFYFPAIDTYIIGGLNQFRHQRKGMRLMFKIVNVLDRLSR